MAAPVNEFLRSKWRQTLRFLDVNRDGEVTREDFILAANTMSKKSKATPEKTAKNLKNWLHWFDLYQPDPTKPIDEQLLLEKSEELYTTDFKKFKKDIYDSVSEIFQLLDFDGDGFISWEEFYIFYESVGIKNKTLARRNFSKIDTSGDGIIQKEEFTNEILRHATDPDPVTGVSHFYNLY